MGAPKNALAFPPKLEDYDPPSKITTACLLVVAVSGWVVTWCSQIIFSCTIGLTMSKKRKQYWNGYLFRLLSAAPVARLTPGIRSKRRRTYEFTPDQINGKSAVMVVCNRSDFDPFGMPRFYLWKPNVSPSPICSRCPSAAGRCSARATSPCASTRARRRLRHGQGSTGQLLADAAAHFQAGNSIISSRRASVGRLSTKLSKRASTRRSSCPSSRPSRLRGRTACRSSACP